MKARYLASPILAWATLGLAMILFVGSVVLIVGGWAPGYDPEIGMLFVAALLVWSALGALLVARLPAHPIGWLFCGVGLVAQVTFFAEVYVGTVSENPPASLAAVAWLETVAGDWATPLFVVFTLLLFPTGRLGTRFARFTAAAALVACAIGALGTAFAPGKLDGFPIANPLGVEGFDEVSRVIGDLSSALLAGVFLLGFAVLAGRLRRSSGIERQQIKWFVLASAILALDLALTALVEALGVRGGDWIGILLFLTSLLALPVAMTFAILRYRLYDIDRIISRTVAYGLLTAALAGGYLVAVLGLQSILPVRDDSPLIVAASTLAVVAAFGPLRSRIGHLVDSRFNRSRYDAEHTIESFGARLRDEVELDALASGLVAVVDRTMAPAHVSLWISPERPT